jgi:hypothetical protein
MVILLIGDYLVHISRAIYASLQAAHLAPATALVVLLVVLLVMALLAATKAAEQLHTVLLEFLDDTLLRVRNDHGATTVSIVLELRKFAYLRPAKTSDMIVANFILAVVI